MKQHLTRDYTERCIRDGLVRLTEWLFDRPDNLSASEALYGFAGWLTSRKQRTVMSSQDDAAIVADLVAKFCEVNQLAEPRDGWEKRFVHPPSEEAQ